MPWTASGHFWHTGTCMTSGTDVAHGEAHQGTTTLHHCMNILDSIPLYLSVKTQPGWLDPVNLMLNFGDVVITLLNKWGENPYRLDEVTKINEALHSLRCCIFIRWWQGSNPDKFILINIHWSWSNAVSPLFSVNNPTMSAYTLYSV